MQDDADVRIWVETDRAGEWVTGCAPLPGLDVFSARGSTRHWSEPLHETFTLAAVRRSDTATGAEWRTRGQSHVTEGGQLMAIDAGDGHLTSRVPAPSAFDVVKLAPSWLDEADGELRPRGASSFRFRESSSGNPAVFAAVDSLVAAVAVQSSRLEVAVRAHELAYTIVTELAPERRRPYAAVRDFRLRRVRERLIEEPSARPVLDDLARDADLGKSQLCALFLREYGLSMGEFWTGCRIAKARALLLEGRPAKDVASELGFTDQAYFSRIFKRHTGLAPGVWTSLYRRNRGR